MNYNSQEEHDYYEGAVEQSVLQEKTEWTREELIADFIRITKDMPHDGTYESRVFNVIHAAYNAGYSAGATANITEAFKAV
jgi:hypothetical protein